MAGVGEPGPRLRPDPIEQYVRGEGRWPLVVERMRQLSKPVIAMVNGHAHGAGFNLALGCDLRLMAVDATLSIPFTRRGIATGTSLLQQFVGVGKAMEWALLAPTLSAADAERHGLVNAVHPPEELATATTELAERLASGPTRVYSITKAAVYRGYGSPTPCGPTSTRASPSTSPAAPRTSTRAAAPSWRSAPRTGPAAERTADRSKGVPAPRALCTRSLAVSK